MPDVLAIAEANAAPVLVGDHVLERDTVAFREHGSEFRGAVEREFGVVAFVLTHFETQGFAIALTFVVGVLTLLVFREALVDRVLVDGVMPGEVTK